MYFSQMSARCIKLRMKLRIPIFYLPFLVLTVSCQEDPVIQALDNLEKKAYESRACQLNFLNENPLDETSDYYSSARDMDSPIAEAWANRKRLEDSQKACLSYQQEQDIAIGEAAKLGASREQIGYLQLSGRTKAEQEYGSVPE